MNNFISLFFKIIFISLFSINNLLYAKDAIKVDVIEIERRSLQEVFEYPAFCRDSQSKDFYAQQSGVVDFITPKQGESIKANEILFSMHSAFAESSLASASHNYKIASEIYQDNVKLYQTKVISHKALENFKLAQDNAKFQLDQAKLQYQNLILTVPFDSFIGVVNFQIGDNVKNGDYLFTVVHGEEKTLLLDLPENFRPLLLKDFSITALDQEGAEIKTNVKAFSNYLDPISDSIKISASVKDKGKFIHNSTVMCRIFANKHQALAVPESCVMEGPNGSFIFLVKDNKAKVQLVELGTRTDGYIEIISKDITQGDLIVFKGLNKIYDKSLVEPNLIQTKK